LAFAGPRPETAPSYGILILAHGGSPAWNEQVLSLRSNIDPRVPTEVAFGMADPVEISRALRRLEERRPGKVVAVPLFINSASEVLDQTRYVLGLSKNPSETMRRAALAMPGHAQHHMFSLERVRSALPLVMTPALDSHPFVGEVLLERARALSRDPKKETVVLVGHGPVDEKALSRWEETMGRLAERLRREGGFFAVKTGTLRDDAAPEVRAAAVRRLREQVAGGGRVLVVPYLIAQGGIEAKIVRALEGLTYEWDSKTIMPHSNISRWVAEVSSLGSRAGDMRLIK
jgi:sirohydrochlorin ferrochelatase